jgi:uncharacterized protein
MSPPSGEQPGLALPGLATMRGLDGPLVRPLVAHGQAVEEFDDLTGDESAQELGRARAVLEQAWPHAAAEVDCFVRGVVASRAAPGHQGSGSSSMCPFVVSVAIERNVWPLALADALVHEAAHVKLRCAMRFVELLDDDGTPRFRHPWRADPRPLEALLVACHAFAAVHRLYVLQVAANPGDGRAVAYAARLEREVAAAMEALGGADGLTPAGRFVASTLLREFERSIRLSSQRGASARPGA